ncbi:Wzz/FepE/Etk N-terminal domain-containing protein [Marinobacter sp. S0848L]|uniref:Wzz/FepE/Etk N-terminal domain-containing protein n=1 Tax=Marinobacter sp. S0848L TaxID=2926423 RepID=UPI001FF12C5A|nr:Wzz/FepE/Etk N-terminal domain-containing protein [Marinobacter sp. S0848L]MCK0107306.1 Wzz/FepE/Etk N-terminal domain-containing protein [Marinobacter sp. S0848L]
MNESLSQRPEAPDEISLVDLATTFIRHRRIFYAVFVTVTLLGVAYAFLTPEKYEYVSLIQIAKKEKGDPIQPAQATIATFENRWLPEVEAAYQAKNDEKLPFNVSINNPESTGLIRFRSEATGANAKAVEAIHESLIEHVKHYQNALVQSARESLVRQTDSLDKLIDSLQGQQNAGEAIASTIEKRSQLESQRESLKSVEVLVVSRQSVDRVSPKRGLIVVLSVLMGVTLGVLLAFMSEFYCSVKAQLRASKLV